MFLLEALAGSHSDGPALPGTDRPRLARPLSSSLAHRADGISALAEAGPQWNAGAPATTLPTPQLCGPGSCSLSLGQRDLVSGCSALAAGLSCLSGHSRRHMASQ